MKLLPIAAWNHFGSGPRVLLIQQDIAEYSPAVPASGLGGATVFAPRLPEDVTARASDIARNYLEMGLPDGMVVAEYSTGKVTYTPLG